MQTFLPFDGFVISAKCLDTKRLGKQRVEVLQLLNALAIGPKQTYDTANGPRVRTTPWYNHPAARMWKGHEFVLIAYGVEICLEWRRRGYNDTCLEKIISFSEEFKDHHTPPKWLGNDEFHASHRSNLLRKNPDWYGQFDWSEPDNLEYVWPK
jgi:hypothetical protein